MPGNRTVSTSARGAPVPVSVTASGQGSARPPGGGPVAAATELAGHGQAVSSSPGGSSAVRLSGREREVLALLAEGASNLEIAVTLFISVNTVERHVANICGKLGARGRTAAVARAIRGALI